MSAGQQDHTSVMGKQYQHDTSMYSSSLHQKRQVHHSTKPPTVAFFSPPRAALAQRVGIHPASRPRLSADSDSAPPGHGPCPLRDVEREQSCRILFLLPVTQGVVQLH